MDIFISRSLEAVISTTISSEGSTGGGSTSKLIDVVFVPCHVGLSIGLPQDRTRGFSQGE